MVVVVPSPQLHAYCAIESPGNGTLLLAPLNVAATPCVIPVGAVIAAVGDSGWNAPRPFGVPTAVGPSNPVCALHWPMLESGFPRLSQRQSTTPALSRFGIALPSVFAWHVAGESVPQ